MRDDNWLKTRLSALRTPGDAGRIPPLRSVLEAGERRKRRRLIATRSVGAAMALAVIIPVSVLFSSRQATTVSGGPGLQANWSNVIRVTCTGSKMDISSTTVAAQSDGVHIDVRRGAGDPGPTGLALPTQGINLGARVDHRVFILPPGEAQLRCLVRSAGANVPFQSVTVVDPGSYWHPLDMACSDYTSVSGEDGPTLDGSDPLALAGKIFGGFMEPGDQAIRVGYLDSTEAHVALVRDGQHIADADLTPRPGGWEVTSVGHCP